MMRNNYHNPQQGEDSVTKISRSKSRNQIHIVTKLKEKESGWNDRFHLEHIPEYNYQNQPHSQYLKNKFRIPNRRNDLSKARRLPEPSLEKNKVSNKPNPRTNEDKLKEAITKAYTDLKSLWYEKEIPECHMQLMTKIFNRENNPMKILQDIKQEFSDVSKEISLIQKITSSIETRQSCLLKIKELEKQFEEDGNILKATKLFQQKISHLRILTIHCIQCIFQWKQSIEPLVPKSTKVRFKFQNAPYTYKIKDDYRQITQSKFRQLYKFDQKKIDAFFLNYTLQGKRISNVSKNLIKRIRLCEIMLGDDDQIQPTQTEQDTGRTPLIQKIKSPPYKREDRSMPPRGRTPVINPWKKLAIEYGQFPDFFLSLLKKSSFAKSFQPFVQMDKYQQLTVFQYQETTQQIVLGIDKNASHRKIIILGLKSAHDTIEAFLKTCCEYLWEHDHCNEIRISLVHHLFGEHLTVDSELQKKIKLVGFRWVSISQNNDQRMTIYSMKRPLNTVAHKSSKRTQAYPVIIEHLTILNLDQITNQKKFPNNCLVGVLSLFKLLEELKKQQHEQICKRDEFSHHLNSLSRIQDFLHKEAIKESLNEGYDTMFTYSGLRAFEIPHQQKLDKIFQSVEISAKEIMNFPSYITLLNASFKFKNITINDGKYTKFFPSKDNEILICQSNYPIYLLQTDEENINFFIIEVEQNFSMQSIDSIFHAMGEQSSFIDQFWLPVFNKSLSYTDDVGMQNRQLISTDYRNNLGSLTRKGKVRTKIIRAPFVFGMINKKLLEMLEIPFYCTLVRKSDLL